MTEGTNPADAGAGTQAAAPNGTAPAPDVEKKCQTCGAADAQEVELERVTSYLILTDTKPVRGRWCAACARRFALREVVWCALLGWWGIPLGFLAGRGVYRNLRVMNEVGKAGSSVVGTFAFLSVVIPLVGVFFLYTMVGYLSARLRQPDDVSSPAPPEYLAALTRGRQFFDKGANREALESYLEAERIYAEGYELHFSKALALRALGRTEEALEAMTRAYYLHQSATTKILVESNAHVGRYAWELGRADQARHILEELARSRQPFRQIYEWYAELLEMDGRPDEAEAVLRSALDLRGLQEGWRLTTRLVGIVARAGRPEEAQEILSDLSPELAIARNHLPQPGMANLEPTLEALLKIGVARQKITETRSAFLALAEEYAREFEALAAKRGAETKPTQAEILARQASALALAMAARLESSQSARKALFDKGQRISNGVSEDCRVGLAEALALEGEFDEALVAIQPLVETDRLRVGLERTRAHLLLRAGKFDAAREIAVRLVAAIPASPDFHALELTIAARSGEPADAIARRVQAANERLAELPMARLLYLIHQARVWLELGRTEEAIAILAGERELLGDRTDLVAADLSFLLARAYLDTADPGRADGLFAHRLADRTDLETREFAAHVGLWRGVSRFLAGEAVPEDWRRIAGLDPSNFLTKGDFVIRTARLLMGLLSHDDWVAQTRILEFGLQDDRDFFEAFALERAGRREDAIRLYTEFLERTGGSSPPRGLARRRLEALRP